MSSIDERVVQMEFQNKNFEKGVQTTLGTLEKLKQSLNFADSAKSLSALETAGRSFDISSMGENLQSVADRFSSLGIIGMQVLTRLTDAAIDFGVKMAKSLSIDQISAGFEKYQENTMNVAAIVNQSGKSIEYVSDQIDQLSWFSDATSYDFNSMTNALARFTAQNIDLEESIPLIMGIGNSISYAGVSAKEGSGAFSVYAKAISQGYVSLREWQQLNTMKVGTAGLKQQFIDAAIELGKLSKDTEVTIENFETTLSKGKWLDKDVMSKVFGEQYGAYTQNIQKFITEYEKQYGIVLTTSEAMELYTGEVDEFGMKAFQSAMEARTFTEAVESVKDAASSQWNKIFELIFGNYEEATELWTEFGDTINDIFVTPLVGLKNFVSALVKLGARNNAIDAIKNSFHALSDVIGAVSEAAKNVFPPKSAKEIASMVNKFRHFTEQMKPTPELLEKIRSRAEQVFKIFKTVGSGAVRIFGGIFKALKPFGSVVQNLFGSIVDFTTYLVDSIRNLISPDIGNFFDSLGSKIETVSSYLNKFITFIFDGAYTISGFILQSELLSKIFGVLKSAAEKVGGAFESLFSKFKRDDTDKVAYATDSFAGLRSVIEGFKTFLAPVASAIGKSISFIKSQLDNMFSGFNIQSLLTLVNGGLITAILLKVKGFVSNIRDFAGQTSIVKNIKGVLWDVQDALGQFQAVLKADALKQIAIALAILAASLFVLASIDSDKLAASLFSVTVLLAEVIGATEGLGNMKPETNLRKASMALKNMATGLLLIAAAVKIMSTIEIPNLIISVIAISGLLAALVYATEVLGKQEGNAKKGASAIKTMSIGLIALSLALKIMASIPFEKMITAIIGLGLVLGEMMVFFAGLNEVKNSVGVAIAVVALSGAILIFTAALSALSFIKPEKLFTAVGAIGALLLVIGLAATVLSGATKGAFAILIMAAALAVMTPALIALSMVPLSKISGALIGLALTFAVLGLAAAILSPLIGTIALLAGSLFLISAAVLVAGIGLTALAVGITALATAFTVGATGIISAISILMLGFIQLREQIFLAVLSVIQVVLQAIAGSVTSLIQTVTTVILAVIQAVRVLLPEVISLGISLVLTLIYGLAVAMPSLLQAGFMLIINFINGLAETLRVNEFILMDAVWNLLSSVIEFVLTALQTLVDGIPIIGGKASEALEGIKEMVHETLAPEDAAATGAAYAESLSEGVLSKEGEMKEASKTVAQTGTDAFNTNFAPKAIVPNVTGTLDEALSGVTGMAPNAENAFESFAGAGLTGLSGGLDIQNILPITDQFTADYTGGIKAGEPQAEKASEDLATKSHDSLQVAIGNANFPNLGRLIASGLAKGITDNTGIAKNAGAQLVKETKKGVEVEAQIKSPSRVFATIGYYAVAGFAKGITDNTSLSSGAARDMATDAINSFSKPLNDLEKVMDGEIDLDPTITPVLDLTNIQNGSKYLDSMLSGKSINAEIGSVRANSIDSNYILASQIESLRQDLQQLSLSSEENGPLLADMIKNALNGVGVYMNEKSVGKIVSNYQANTRRAYGQ